MIEALFGSLGEMAWTAAFRVSAVAAAPVAKLQAVQPHLRPSQPAHVRHAWTSRSVRWLTPPNGW
jgi:hypothetical protein